MWELENGHLMSMPAPPLDGYVEHVRNVLARLNNPATPEQAQTSSRLSQVSVTDTAQSNRLRPTHLDKREVQHA